MLDALINTVFYLADYQLYYSRYKGNLFELKMVICGAEDVLWHFMPAALVHVVEKKTLKMLNPKDFTVQVCQ